MSGETSRLQPGKRCKEVSTMTYDFLVDTYATERLKVLSVWSEFHDGDLQVRPRADDPRPERAGTDGSPVRQRGHVVQDDARHRRWCPAAAEARSAHRVHPAVRR